MRSQGVFFSIVNFRFYMTSLILQHQDHVLVQEGRCTCTVQYSTVTPRRTVAFHHERPRAGEVEKLTMTE